MGSDENSAVKAGVFVILCGVLLVVVIVVLGRSSQLFTPQYTLWTEFRNAQGLMPGTDVRLAGVSAGSVRSVRIAVNGKGTKVVRVYMNIVKMYQPMITAASSASIRTLGALGDKYVEISFETAAPEGAGPGELDPTAILRDGSRIKAEEATDFYEIARQAKETLVNANSIAGQVESALKEFHNTGVIEDISANVKSLQRMMEKIETGDGLLHMLVYDKGLPKVLAATRETAESLRATARHIEKGPGGLHELIYGDTLKTTLTDAADTVAKAKRILKQVEEGDGTAHALLYEQKERKVIEEVGKAAQMTNRILADIREGRGTLGLLIADPELWESLKRLLGGVEESRTLKFLISRQLERE